MTKHDNSKFNEKDSDIKPSDMFIDSLSEGGISSDDITCGWCDRTHLCPDANCDVDEWDADCGRGEWRELCEQRHKDNPHTTVLHYDYDNVLGREINGIMFVIDCPCNGLYRYEAFIWEHRNTIRQYLKSRVEQEYIWADQELTLNKLAGISK